VGRDPALGMSGRVETRQRKQSATPRSMNAIVFDELTQRGRGRRAVGRRTADVALRSGGLCRSARGLRIAGLTTGTHARNAVPKSAQTKKPPPSRALPCDGERTTHIKFFSMCHTIPPLESSRADTPLPPARNGRVS
jgi:hypothetical protein